MYENSTWSPSIAIKRLLLIATRLAYRAGYSTVLFAASKSCGFGRLDLARTWPGISETGGRCSVSIKGR